jgi:hypothetical protein
MAHFQKNLLEAFRDAEAADPGDATGAGPFVESDDPKRRPPTPDPDLAAGLPGSAIPAIPPFLLVMGALALIAAGVLVGRLWMAAEARAAGDEPAAGAESQVGQLGSAEAANPWFAPEAAHSNGGAASAGGAPPLPAATPGPSSTLGAPGSANPLLDSENRFTSIAIEYTDTALNRELAVATQDYLRSNGFPDTWAWVQKGTILVYVGASASLADVQAIVKRLQKTPGPGGKKDFGEAYSVNIDDYIQR